MHAYLVQYTKVTVWFAFSTDENNGKFSNKQWTVNVSHVPKSPVLGRINKVYFKSDKEVRHTMHTLQYTWKIVLQ